MLLDFINLFFPKCCITCKSVLIKSEQWLCTACLLDLPTTDYHIVIDNPVAQKFYGRVAITYAMALYKFRLGNSIEQIIYHIKYQNKPRIAEVFGRTYGTYLAQINRYSKFDCIVPVPLHAYRLSERGYNQSDFFAKGLAALLNIPWYNNCVTRVKHTDTQTQKNKEERLANVKDVFGVVDSSIIQNKHVLLVDDVITSGATLEACALLLLSAGAKQISVAAIAVVE